MHTLHLTTLFIYITLAQSQIQVLTFTDLETALDSTSEIANFTTLFKQLNIFSQVRNLGNITILAPSNNAIDRFLRNTDPADLTNDQLSALFAYHILPGNYSILSPTESIPTFLSNRSYVHLTDGQNVLAAYKNAFISGLLQESNVTRPAIQFNSPYVGSYILVIDHVLTIPLNLSSTSVALNLTSSAGAFRAAPDVSTTVGANLTDVTAFIPLNSEFQRVGSLLTGLPGANLTDIMQYHISVGSPLLFFSNDAVGSIRSTFQNGANLTTRKIGKSWFVNNAKIITPNVLISNGVMHIIDQVLNPYNTSLAIITDTASGLPAFAGASSVSQVPFTSGIPTPTSALPNSPSITGSSTNPSNSSNSTNFQTGNASNTGAIAGGVVGGIALIALIALAVWFWKRSRSTTKPVPTVSHSDLTEHPEKSGLAELSASERAELEAQDHGSRGGIAAIGQSEFAELNDDGRGETKKFAVLEKN